VQADYAKPLAETQTGRASEPHWLSPLVLSGSTADHGPDDRGVLGGRSLVEITSAAAVSGTRHTKSKTSKTASMSR
jgi:hypothetical protein